MNIFWRGDIDSVEFRPIDHEGLCMVHRLALRTLIGFKAEPDECVAYVERNWAVIVAAAADKIAARKIAHDRNFNLNSRDIRRAKSCS